MLKALGAIAVLTVLLLLAASEILDRGSEIKALKYEVIEYKERMESLNAAVEARETERRELNKRLSAIISGIEELKRNDKEILEWATTPIPDGVVDFMRKNRPVW